MRFFHRSILCSHPNGDRTDYIAPGGSFSMDFEVPEREFPVTHSLRLVGEADYFWKWRFEAGAPYAISMVLDDALTRHDTWRETYALMFHCNNEPYERNAWLKLTGSALPAGRHCRFVFAAKTENLQLQANGAVCAELEIYFAREDRHPDDVFDPPDQIIRLSVPAGTSDWREFFQEFELAENAVAIIVHIGVKGASGRILLGSPRLYADGSDSLIPPLDRQQKRESDFCYVAENISRRDWLELDCLIDGKKVFEGELYSPIFRRPDREIDLGAWPPGRHTLTLKFRNFYDSAVGFVLQQLELLEYGNHDVELIAAPEYASESHPGKMLLKSRVDHVDITVNHQPYHLEAAGYHAVPLPPPDSPEMPVTIQVASHSDSFLLKRVPGGGTPLFLSTGDAIFAPQTVRDLERFLEWYLGGNFGNAVCFRHSYRWGGGRFMNADIWQKIIPLLQKLGIAYFLMVDGRELPGKNSNPPDSLLAGAGYLGRQAHENDGVFYYWGNTLWRSEALPVPYADILSRSIDPGGIQPHVRPKRRGNQAWWFFDPTDAADMRQASEALVHNLAEARGASTRHSGPSTLFRYFFQAGYQFLLAEQMYGPEEVILASLRGASRAYHAEGFGAHLATQWSSTPHDTPEHADRYFLSLATCYLQGVTQINTEEGLYRMEKDYVDYDRFSANCLRHQAAHLHFHRFMQTHPRRGNLVVRIGCVQGRYDGWCSFYRGNVWRREGEQWQFSAAEESFDLLNVFYPRSFMGDIYRCPCPIAPQGWYSGTPYGPVDLIPFEGDWKSYRALIFLGWHTFQPKDAVKMLDYVRRGGILLLTKQHLSTALEHNGAPSFADCAELDTLLGSDWRTQQTGIRHRKIEAGSVIFFTETQFPASPAIRAEYEAQMHQIARQLVEYELQSGWCTANEDINFAVYEQPDGTRQIYLLNIRWWDRQEATATLWRDGVARHISIPFGEIIEQSNSNVDGR